LRNSLIAVPNCPILYCPKRKGKSFNVANGTRKHAEAISSQAKIDQQAINTCYRLKGYSSTL
jgi:hypothetical protein